MLEKFWVVLFVALAGAQVGRGLPLRSAPPAYPHESPAAHSWTSELAYVLPALALLVTAGGLLFGCAWCFGHKDCKPEEGADNQLFTASAAVQNVRNPPDSGFYEASNNNISEDNNNGPISLREMQNIANNNATAYISADNEQRNTASRESVVEFEPLPREIGVTDPLERCADWFVGDDLPRNRLQYLREIGRGWFGRVVEGEIDNQGSTSTVAVKILNQNATLEEKARFLNENRLYKDVRHENVLRYVAKYLGEDPWLLMFELCSMDLQQYLEANRPKMAILNENGVPLKLICDVTSALAYLHSRGYLYGNVSCNNVLVRVSDSAVSAVLGGTAMLPSAHTAPECRQHQQYTSASEVWSLGTFIWEVSAWGASPTHHPPPLPDLPFPYSNHLYQVMQLCWDPNPELRPTSAQVDALVHHLLNTREGDQSDGDFEGRWQRLKPNTIPKVDEHIAIIHAPSTSHFSTDTLSIDMDTGVSRSSSILSDQFSNQIKSESLNNLHGSLEDVRNIYLTHNEQAAIECHQGNIPFDDKEDRSDSSVDPWLKDIIAGSQDDVSYYKDVSDVIKNLDNILNSEKTSSSESSHQASPSRDNLSLDCKKEAPVQSSLVKSPGISNFQNILEAGLDEDENVEDEDKDTVGTLSHSFERHSDTTSQHTLENLTPDTPVKDDNQLFSAMDKSPVIAEAAVSPIFSQEVDKTPVKEIILQKQEDIPKDEKRSVNKLPNLRELSVTSLSSVSENEQLNIRELIPSDSLEKVRTEVETKSVDKLNEKSNAEIVDAKQEVVQKLHEASNEINKTLEVLPENVAEIASNLVENEVIKPAIESVYKMQQDRPKHVHDEYRITTLLGSMPTHHTQRNNHEVHRNIIPFEQVMTLEPFKDPMPVQNEFERHEINVEQKSELKDVKETTEANSFKYEPGFEDITSSLSETPEPVQSLSDDITEVTNETEKLETTVSEVTLLATELTDNLQTSTEPDTYPIGDKIQDEEERLKEQLKERLNEVNANNEIHQGNDSTAYKDLINNTSQEIDNFKKLLDHNSVNSTWLKDESTAYLDLPSILKDTNEFLHNEKVNSSVDQTELNVCASTPKDNTIVLHSAEVASKLDLSENKSSNHDKEQKVIPESPSPFDSPTKSHPTDTYDENSSVVLGPFETSMENKPLKDTDIPKEELLAFSSNFNEINLATPSPLSDGNFLNEVPDIGPEFTFDDFSANKSEINEPKSENSESEAGTTKHVSPSTPPNSPGMFLASTSQQKYLVDIDIDHNTPSVNNSYPSTVEAGPSWQNELDIHINEFDMHITSKLAMAENENNLNIEYSGPLTVEGIVSDEEVVQRDNDSIPEAILAGNGGSIEDLKKFSLDEECVKALRDELELKLPLAQVASIEPACQDDQEGDSENDPSWSTLPPPPEMVVCYLGGALSPIAEETRHQLSAYESDAWNTSNRTDSSESYLEPCNNSTDEVTDLPTGTQPTGSGNGSPSNNHSTYTVHSEHSANDTYTVQRDIPSSKEITMSPDSLNSPYRKPKHNQIKNDPLSPIDDEASTKNDDKESCEHISQESPFLLSPTTDTTAQGNTPTENATAISTLSKTTDAKQPEDGLSKATTIDSWCSNDTLYNVEENFDDLALENDAHLDEDKDRRDDKSEGTETLNNDKSEGTNTLNNDDKSSHNTTYIIHDSDSDCDTFSPDSITEKDNHTYTKVKTEQTVTPSLLTTKTDKTETNDTTKDTEVVDLAYGTLPSYSSCTTEVVRINDPWMIQPEMIRHSPVNEIDVTPPKNAYIESNNVEDNPNITQPCLKKMDSVEITCLEDDSLNNQNNEGQDTNTFQCLYKNMTPSVTSTPLGEPVLDSDDDEDIPIPCIIVESPPTLISPGNFQAFIQSAEIRHQDLSNSNEPSTNLFTGTDTGLLLEGESKMQSTSFLILERTPNYSDFETSVLQKDQEVHSSSQNSDTGHSSEDFRNFETSVRLRPQDLSPFIEASSMFLNSERKSSSLGLSNDMNSRIQEPLPLSPPNFTNLVESQPLVFNNESFAAFCTDMDEETDQPHSIIITDVSKELFTPKSPIANEANSSGEVNKTYNSHERNVLNETYSSHDRSIPIKNDENEITGDKIPKTETNAETHVNGEIETNQAIVDKTSPAVESNNIVEAVNSSTVNYIENQDVNNHNGDEIKYNNGVPENYATVNFINETFEEIIDNVDNEQEDKIKDVKTLESQQNGNVLNDTNEIKVPDTPYVVENQVNGIHDDAKVNGDSETDTKLTAVTENFLQNEKDFCRIDAYLPLLRDIRFSGPTSEIMSTSFTQDSPTEPDSPECEGTKQDTVTDIVKEWDSDTDSQTSHSSSGEFIWKQRSSGHTGHSQAPPTDNGVTETGSTNASGDSGSGSEGDEVEFVPSSWDCRAEPAKSSLRTHSLTNINDSKKRVVFKRQKYHCVYEYPREAVEVDTHSPAYLPDFSTYCEWDPSSAEDVEMGYGQLFGGPSPLDMYPLRGGYGADYDEDFFISSSARPFEALGVMSTTSQFFPGMHAKAIQRELAQQIEVMPAPPSPLPAHITAMRTPSLDFTTPDSGVEDITPGSTITDEDFKTKKPDDAPWKPADSTSSSESVSPSSPGGEALGGLRHTRDKLKLDLPPSPHIPSPRHNRVFNFILEKPKRHRHEGNEPTTPLIMSDETPVVTSNLSLDNDEIDRPPTEATFSTFGKDNQKNGDAENKIVLDEVEEKKDETPVKETVKGEGTVLDSGDEDSGIESCSKASLERKTNFTS